MRRKFTGAKQATDDANKHIIYYYVLMVGEHPNTIEARSVRTSGGVGRENVGMSNHKANEKLAP